MLVVHCDQGRVFIRIVRVFAAPQRKLRRNRARQQVGGHITAYRSACLTMLVEPSMSVCFYKRVMGNSLQSLDGLKNRKLGQLSVKFVVANISGEDKRCHQLSSFAAKSLDFRTLFAESCLQKCFLAAPSQICWTISPCST